MNVDWRVLRGALALFGLCLLISTGLVAASGFFKNQMRAEHEAQQQRFRAISARYLAVDDEERIIHEYLPQFVRYFDAGVIGGERRLDWLEALRAAGSQTKLPELSYDIDSQALFQPEFPLALGEFDVYSSRMSLKAGLLHEGDLIDLLSILDERAAGLYTVSRCTLGREGDTLDLSTVRANIMANCDLHWYTLKLRGGRDIEL
jgi:hypothetical protein